MSPKINLTTFLTISVLLLATLCTSAVGKTIYVEKNATGANDGSSWADAYNFLQDALADAKSAEKPIEVWVTEGTYTPDSNSVDPNGTGKREATFGLINGVSIYGGFPSGGTEFEKRDPNLNETILSGDLDGDDVTVNDPCDLLNEPSRAENSYHVVTGEDVNEIAVLDGLTIKAGNANGPSYYSQQRGGGIYIYYGTPTVNNCTFSENSANEGGGIYSFGGSPTATNCTFEGNWAGTLGGGICNIQSGKIPTNLTNCTFKGNGAGSRGGGMCNIHTSPILTNCTFSSNSARNGGGIDNDSVFSGLSNCMFSGNSADESGGGIYSFASSAKVADCNFSGNSVGESGGGMCDVQSSSTMTNCIFEGNSAEDDGGGMYNKSSNSTLTYCTFRQNTAFDEGGGVYENATTSSSLSDCTFSENSADKGGGIYNGWVQGHIVTNCTFSSNSAHNGGGMYNFQSGLTLINCTFTGNTANSGGGMDNYRSDPIMTNCTFSGNSADYVGGGMYNRGYSNPTLNDCTFNGNSAAEGGGIYNTGSKPRLTQCMFYGNKASVNGGALVDIGYAESTLLSECVFAGNWAEYGGAIWIDEQSSILMNCTFGRNVARQAGGAIYCWDASVMTLTNCILWDNIPHEIEKTPTSVMPEIYYSDVKGGWTSRGDNNIDLNPLFADPGDWVDVNNINILIDPNDPNAVWIDGDYHLKSEAGRWDPNSQSWVLDDVNSPCIDAGDPLTCIGFEPNPNGDIVNMGAYGGTAEASLSPSGISCISANRPEYDEWIQFGAPACWCYSRQRRYRL
ncbi:MAG: right-handed parallel beta-helix repeat-containing protein [Planctomycetota bacterium]|jgi:parallel beta-helix repeat protein